MSTLYKIKYQFQPYQNWYRFLGCCCSFFFSSSFCSKFLFFDVIDSLVLKTADFHTKKGVIEAVYVDFWLVCGFNHVRGFKHQPIVGGGAKPRQGWYTSTGGAIPRQRVYFFCVVSKNDCRPYCLLQ